MDGTITETQNLQSKPASSVLRTSPRTGSRNAILSPLPTLSITTTSTVSVSSTVESLQRVVIDRKPDTVQTNTTSLTSRNKRKNFNPRCSSINDDDITVDRGHNKDTYPGETADRQPEMLPSLLSANSTTITSRSYNSHDNSFSEIDLENSGGVDNGTSTINSSGNSASGSTNSITTTMLKSWHNLVDLHQYRRYKGSVMKPHHSRSNKTNSNDFHNIPRVNKTNQQSDDSFTDGDHQITRMTTATTSVATSTPTLERQLKNEFACNAFNAVQELLNVYGLSISPGDIVDAFKKQQQQQLQQQQKHSLAKTGGECPQPPTPPRTPISSLSTSSTITSSAAASNSEHSSKDKDHHHQQQNHAEHQQSTPEKSGDHHERASSDHNPFNALASIAKLLTPSAISSATAITPTSHQQSVDKKSPTGESTSNNNFHLEVDYLNDNCVGDDTRTIGDDDDYDVGEMKTQQNLSDNNFSERFDESSSMNLYDINHCDNDSNISSTIIDDDRASSDDITMGGDNVAIGDNRGYGEGSTTGADDEGDAADCETRAGLKSADSDMEGSRFPMKNVDNLLDKCPLNIFSPILQLGHMQNDDKQLHAEGLKCLTKYSSYLQCKTDACQLENLREHYHCYDIPCLGKTFNKKEEIIRHLKWHKKRAESLNHGFLRFSSSDDCSLAFGSNCTHNRKQTHYHCFQPNCDKVYISTSDVQMHSNYHRKDSAIYQEGFQRYRATEECNAEYCMFAGQRTTHFHCRRDNCRYTFKNKADMEKHKSYHIKDLQLARDGFKKFLKTEPCPYERCRFSRICNHIHCVRENCHYVLHSSGQLLSHKRKHERMDSEQAYRRFKIAQKAAAAAANMLTSSAPSPSGSGSNSTSMLANTAVCGPISGGTESKPSTPSTSSSIAISPDLQIPPDLTVSFAATKGLKSDTTLLAPGLTPSSHQISQPSQLDMNLLYTNTGLSLDILQQIQQRHQKLFNAPAADDPNFCSNTSGKPPPPTATAISHPPSFILPSSLLLHSLSRSAVDEIEDLIRQYFTTNCTRQHIIDQIEPLNLKSSASSSDQLPRIGSSAGSNSERIECLSTTTEPHLHCLFKNCEAIIPRNLVDISEHMQIHELSRNADNIIQNSNLLQITSIEGFFNRKRGRPPKNRVVEVYNNARNQSPQAIFTSFKLEKTLNDPQVLSPPLASMNTNQPRSLFGPATSSTSTITSFDTNQASSNISTNANTINLSAHQAEGRIQAFHSDAQKCEDTNCQFVRQFHFHCKFSEKCDFATKDPFALELHLNESHKVGRHEDDSSEQTSHRPLKCWEFYETSTNCQFNGCDFNQRNNHFHCTKCNFVTTVQSEIERHSSLSDCMDEKTNLDNAYQNRSASSSGRNVLNNLLNYNSKEEANSKSLSRTTPESSEASVKLKFPNPESVGSGHSMDDNFNTELGTNNSIKTEPMQTEDEKVSVVRAAGTYFPQNSNNSNDIEAGNALHRSEQTSPSSECNSSLMCPRPFCRLKRKSHQHCNLCSQAFSDSVKLEIHRLKHSTFCLTGQEEEMERGTTLIKDEPNAEDNSSPQDLTKTQQQASSSPTSSPLVNFSNAAAAMAAAMTPSAAGLQQIVPPNFVDNFSLQNLHMAQFALYQHNPFYYQNFYPFLGSQNLPAAFAAHPELLQAQLAAVAAAASGGCDRPKESSSPEKSTDRCNVSGQVYPFASVAAAAGNATPSSIGPTIASGQPFEMPKLSQDLFVNSGRRKRKADDFDGAVHGLMEMGIPSASALVTVAGNAKKMFKTNKQANFKMFKDEPIPQGYLKFRFNEDCNFPNCGYRNHQSHFHCCRKDCYYSFCDKTRFVQHTARHERLDKLMGDDFKQFRANMRCGYGDCAYNKNLAGQNNKSSHFHCLKCNFICSDTNKVVAHRRQHSKMEFIRMAGFRKVANNEKCTARSNLSTSTTATSSSEQMTEISSSTETPGTGGDISSGGTNTGNECTYSLKQTHYHCLICDCSVLSRAQLGSHRHRVP